MRMEIHSREDAENIYDYKCLLRMRSLRSEILHTQEGTLLPPCSKYKSNLVMRTTESPLENLIKRI